MKRLDSELAIFTGNANPGLAKAICRVLHVRPSACLVGRFSEGEIRVKINENVRGKDVFIVQPTCPPSNDNLMELLILLDAIRRASARRITAVIPYYGYARQDRKDQPRVPITAKLVANLITTAGANRVLTMDLHAGQIQGFFDIPLDHLYAVTVFQRYLSRRRLKSLIVVSPDVGGIKIARAYAKRLEAGLAVVDKRRTSPESTEVIHILGEVRSSSARYDRENHGGQTRGRDQGRGRARAGAEVSDFQAGNPAVPGYPLRGRHHAIRKHLDIETIEFGFLIGFLFSRREQIHEESGETGLVQVAGDMPVPGTEAVAARAMGENHQSDGFQRQAEVGIHKSPGHGNLQRDLMDFVFHRYHKGAPFVSL